MIDIKRFNATMKDLPAVTISITPAPSTSLPYLEMFIWTVNITTPFAPVILLFGLITNIINIVIFLKAGVKDNVTTLLLSLALSDLTFIILTIPVACTLIIVHFDKSWPWPFHFFFVYALPYWPAYTAYDLSAFISVSLGVMRCACVAMPLKFKLVFTKGRTVFTVLVLTVLAIGLRIPVLTIFRIAWRTDPVTNTTTAYVATVNRDGMSRINDVVNRGIVIWINIAIMISCVGLLSYKLQEASRIRHSYMAKDETSEKRAGDGLSPKDLQVVKSVVLVCIIFILSQLPFMLYSTARLIHPEMTSNGRLKNLFGIFSCTSLTLSYLNASLNIFVYYNYNSKYRSVFLSLLSLKKKK